MTFGVVTFHGHPLNEFSMDICTMLILGFFIHLFLGLENVQQQWPPAVQGSVC